MKWFNYEEFACKCCGQLLYKENVTALVENVLDPVREQLGKAIIVNSGYRCPKHNKDVGGVRNSQHLKGEAADIRVEGSGMSVEGLADAIKQHGVFDQLIIYPTFVHVSYKPNGLNRRQVLWHR